MVNAGSEIAAARGGMEHGGGPKVSVIMANLNGAAHIAEAVRSVLNQTERDLELIVSDDGSNDDSVARARTAGGADVRLIILSSQQPRTGPAATRNRALAAARGAWIGIVDSDDTIAPERFERLLAAAERDGADIAADDMDVFYEDAPTPPHGHLRAALTRAPSWVSVLDYARSNTMFGGGGGLGYLKPVFRREGRYGAAPLYDETLRIGEDYDLVLRMLLKGGRMRIYPERMYRYRKHARSTSHRLSIAAIDAMVAAQTRHVAGDDAALRSVFNRQHRALLRARAFEELVAAIKARNVGAAVSTALRRPSALLLLRYPIAARIARMR